MPDDSYTHKPIVLAGRNQGKQQAIDALIDGLARFRWDFYGESTTLHRADGSLQWTGEKWQAIKKPQDRSPA